MVKQDKNFVLFPFRATAYIDFITSKLLNQNMCCSALG